MPPYLSYYYYLHFLTWVLVESNLGPRVYTVSTFLTKLFPQFPCCHDEQTQWCGVPSTGPHPLTSATYVVFSDKTKEKIKNEEMTHMSQAQALLLGTPLGSCNVSGKGIGLEF